jgi:hypothetical protein
VIIYGAWFRQESAKKHNATLQVKSHDYLVTIDGGLVLQGKKSELLVSDRIGNLERELTLPDGSILPLERIALLIKSQARVKNSWHDSCFRISSGLGNDRFGDYNWLNSCWI